MRFGGDDDRVAVKFLGIFQDHAGRAYDIGMIENIGGAFGVGGDRRIGMLRLELEQLGLAERFVDDADTRPEHHVAPGLLGEIGAEMLVRAEDDLLVERDLRQDMFGR